MRAVFSSLKISFWFYLFVFTHLVVWTLAPISIRFTLPMDAIEGALWGKQLEWGYDKNPFLNGWLTELALLFGRSGWATYLFSQISVAICFIAVWRLSKKFLSPVYALLSVLLLEAIQYYNIHAIDFNDNTLELSLWALTILFFYRAVLENKKYSWLATGLFASLSMMTKYYTIVLLGPMFLFLLVNTKARQAWQEPFFYGGLIIFFLIITPHFIWLFQHDFVTLYYALLRVSAPPTLWNHFIFPLQFLFQQCEALLPALALVGLFFLGKKLEQDKNFYRVSSFDQEFLYFVGIGPLLLTVLLSFATGIRLRAAWGQPLFSLFGLLFLLCLQPRITFESFKRFCGVYILLFVIMVSCYCVALLKANEPSSANYPGKEIATTLSKKWHDTYHIPLRFVAGDRWLAGNIALYTADRPSVYINWKKRLSPWIDENKLKQAGALFVWDTTADNQVPLEDIKKRFQHLTPREVFYFQWLRNKTLPPIEVIAVFLPPTTSSAACPRDDV